MSQYLDKQICLSSHTVPCTTLKWKVRYKSRKFMEIMVFCLFCGYMSLEAWCKNTQEMLIPKHKTRLAPFVLSLSLKPEMYQIYSIINNTL